MNARPPDRNHPSRLELETWLSGDAGAASPDLRAHMEACPDCAGRAAAMRSQGERFRLRNPTFAALSARRSAPSPARRFGLWLAGPKLPSAALATLALAAAAILWTRLPGPGSGHGIKGSPAFLLFDSRRMPLDPGDTVKVGGGDTLQLAVTSETPIRYRIFSRSEDGALAELLPLPGESDSLGAARKGQVLPHSLVYSDPVRTERIICVWSRKPLDWKAARALLANGCAAPVCGADSFQVIGKP